MARLRHSPGSNGDDTGTRPWPRRGRLWEGEKKEEFISTQDKGAGRGRGGEHTRVYDDNGTQLLSLPEGHNLECRRSLRVPRFHKHAGTGVATEEAHLDIDGGVDAGEHVGDYVHLCETLHQDRPSHLSPLSLQQVSIHRFVHADCNTYVRLPSAHGMHERGVEREDGWGGGGGALTYSRVEIILDSRTVNVRLDLEVLDIAQHAADLGALRRQFLELHHPCDLCAPRRDHADLFCPVFADHVERELVGLERHRLYRAHALCAGGGYAIGGYTIGGCTIDGGTSGGGGFSGAGPESADGDAAGGN